MTIEIDVSETWFRSTPESERLASQERLVLEVSELVSEALEKRGALRQDLAGMLKVSPSEVSQRLSGRRNLSLRSLADMLHALGFGIEAHLVDRREGRVAPVKQEGRRMDWPSESTYRANKPGLRVVAGRAA